MRLLLEHAADPNAATQEGCGEPQTPLMMAARRGDADAVHMLLAAGADTSIERRVLSSVD